MRIRPFVMSWKRFQLAALFFNALCATGLLGQASPSSAVAFTHVNVISMKTEAVLTDQTVLVDHHKIVKIGPANQVAVPHGAVRINGTGQFLIPGLSDLHVHLFAPEDLFSYAAYGITTVLNMDGAPMHLRWREQVRKGLLLGPSIYTAGHTTDGYPPLNEMFVTAEKPDEAARLIQETKRAGYDFVKLYGTLRPDVFRSILAAAAVEKIPVVGHINRQVGALEVLKTRQVLAAHLEDLLFSRFDSPPADAALEEFANAIAASKITVTPNLNVNPSNTAQLQDLNAVLASPDTQFLPPAAYSQWMPANNRNERNDVSAQIEQMAQVQKILYRLAGLLRDRGVRLVLGTDAAPYGIPGISAHEELNELVDAGFKPYQALLTATRNAGTFIAENVPGAPAFGTLEEGSVADLVLLSADPLQDIHNTRKIAGVMLRGRWLPASELADLQSKARLHSSKVKKQLVEIDADLEAGDIAKAQKAAAPLAAERSPWIAEWVLMTKARKLQSDKPAAAIAVARWTTQLYPDSFSAWHLLADLLLQTGDYAQSGVAARKSAVLEPHNAANLVLLEKIKSLQTPTTFRPEGTYQVQMINDQSGETQKTELVVDAQGKGHLTGTKSDPGGKPEKLRSVLAGADHLWVAADSQFGLLELRMAVHGDEIEGYWAGPFGHNGKLTGKKSSQP